MKIGVISDSHDHLPNLRHALGHLEAAGVKTVIHCGDLIAPFVTLELGRFDGQVHTVFGNNDGDRLLAQRLADGQASNVTHHGEVGLVELGGQRLAFSHYEGHARGHALANDCQVALFGHTHLHQREQTGDLVLVNPGELLGMKGQPSFCIYDTESGQAERCTFATQPWPDGPWE
jgi:putative phosphoesterase